MIQTDSSFDSRLFRQNPPMLLEARTDVEIHPMIHELGGMIRLPPLIRTCSDTLLNAFDYPASNEFATAPACTFVFVELGTGDPLYVRDPTGITVRLLATKLAEYWTIPPSWSHAQTVRQFYRYGQDVEITKWNILYEVWHLILEELDYIGASFSLSSSCPRSPPHHARAAVHVAPEQDARLDDRLFRTKAPKRLKPGTIVAIHPILDETICIFSDKKPVAYADINRDSGRTVFAYPAAEEFATNPACSVMLVHLNTSKPLPVTDRNGVKVKRLLQRLSWYWNAKPPLIIRYAVASNLEMDPDKVGWIDTLGNHCGWAGWEFGKVEEDRFVHVHANWYDS
ncbi:salivary gland secretion 1 [Rhodotorula toruloides]|uniref:Salivary gland secretion 1 n=1 Tax=Rhodotorula toruloides TaxID=5286 RepID=A0A511KIP1_RHOTO|nr:salivary gland secretion 1 [Rhodotorula toruloides]